MSLQETLILCAWFLSPFLVFGLLAIFSDWLAKRSFRKRRWRR